MNFKKEGDKFFENREFDAALDMFSLCVKHQEKEREYALDMIELCEFAKSNEEAAMQLYITIFFVKELHKSQKQPYTSITPSRLIDRTYRRWELSSELVSAINYEDFLRLVKERGSFKEAYVNLEMSQTKLIFERPTDYYDFVKHLYQNGFEKRSFECFETPFINYGFIDFSQALRETFVGKVEKRVEKRVEKKVEKRVEKRVEKKVKTKVEKQKREKNEDKFK